MTPSDWDIADAMKRYGGGFVKALAEAWFKADAVNQQRIVKAFPDYWAEYRDMVKLEWDRASRDS